jgi:primosomal protein N' (replication factor Y)
VPDVPSFAVDDGFAYSVPATSGPVAVGSIVRVPLGGRTVRGFVTAVSDHVPERTLRPLAAVSGDFPVFDTRLLQTARWVASHYIAPLAAVLARTAPPNLPRTRATVRQREVPGVDGPLVEWGKALAAGRRSRPRSVVTGVGYSELAASALAPILAAGRNAMVAVPTAEEATRFAADLETTFGKRVLLVTSQASAAVRTTAWSRAAGGGGFVLVGTREIALWPAGDLAAGVVIEEGRRAFKSPRTPTMQVRDVLRRRATVERFGLLFAGPVPTTEVLAGGAEIDQPAGRVWPLVEVVDRAEEPPGAGIVMERTRTAIRVVVRSGGRAFVLVPRRGYAPAFRCVQCRELRRCVQCGSAIDRTGQCRRCGASLGPCSECGASRFEALGAGIGRVVDDLRRSFGDAVTPMEGGGSVRVGTERDLVGVSDVDLAVAVDADGPILAPHYRAPEDALRLLARLALTVQRGRGKRCMVQTGDPHHPVIEALRFGKPFPFLDEVLAERAATQFPPVGEIIAIEAVEAEDADAVVRAAAEGATVLGPAPGPMGDRWLIQGADLHRTRILLRSAVQSLRDAGARVRIDADPVDL